MLDIKLPEIGENITSGQVVSIMVAVGDTVKKDQDLLELETDKASLPVPSPADGVIKEILVKEGQDVEIGSVIMKIEEGSDAGDNDSSQDTKDASSKKESQESDASQKEESAETSDPKPTEQKQSQPAADASSKETQQPQPQPQESTVDVSNINLAVVGGGPGGYAAAFLAADLGMKVTLIDIDKNPGGVCLYRGCIPSKALLHAAKIVSEARDAKDLGVEFGEPKIDLDKLRNWKQKVVDQMTGGLGVLSKQRKINYVQGRAEFIDSTTLRVKKTDGAEEKLNFDKIIIATGSRPINLPFAPDSKRVLDSTSALEIENVPKNMLLVGGGYIGLELGTVYAELGSEVSVVEMLPQILTGSDRDIAKVLEKRLDDLMKDVMVNTKVTAMEETDKGIKVSFEDKDGQKSDEVYEKVLVAIGRKPNSENLGLDHTKVEVNDKGFIDVNAQLQTTDPNIYAIGDIVGNPMLAHKASHEGRTAVEAIAGHKVAFEPAAIPAVMFTDPEVAWAGLTADEAKKQGKNVEVVKFPWAASGRAVTLNRTEGLTKLIVDPSTQRILGVAIVGPGAGEMIAEGVLAIEMGAVIDDIRLSIHAHPTLTETVMEAAESFLGLSTHIYRPKKKK